MSKKMKLKLNSFTVQSFITSDESEKIKGGDAGGGGVEDTLNLSCQGVYTCDKSANLVFTCGCIFDPGPGTGVPS